MIEILFGESESAAMKAAKNMVVVGKSDGPASVWIVGKKQLSKKENCGWMEGMPDEVICLGFLLDIGDIKEEIDSGYRKELIYSMYSRERWGKNGDIDFELQKLGDCYCNEMERLLNYLEDGEALRVWYSDAPYSICGFYHLCSILQNYENEISAVKLPNFKAGADSIISYSNWGEVTAEEFAGFLSYEKKLAMEQIRMYALLWGDLKKDNSPLRTVINGRLTGVPEYFYDFLIWKNLTTKPIKEARLIGNMLGMYQISIGDWWYAKRIDFFIEQGKIIVVEDSENKYARTISLA